MNASTHATLERSKPNLDQKAQSRPRLDAPAQRPPLMARSFGKLLSRIWDDEDFLALDVGPQRLYGFLVSQSNINHAGLLPLTLKKWSKKAKNLTVAQVAQDLAVLDRGRFVVLDEDTEELLVRTYIRNDDIWKAPRMMGAAVSGAREIESRRLRRALLIEAGRIPVHELSDEPTKARDGGPAPSIRSQVQGHIRTLQLMFADLPPAPGAPSGSPSAGGSTTPPEGAAEGAAEPPAEGAADGDPEGAPDPPRDGASEGARQPPPEGGDQGGPQGANARRRGPAPTRVTPTPTPTPNPPSSPQATDSLGYPQASGGSDEEGTDPDHTAALAILGDLPARLRPSRGSGTQVVDAIAELVGLGWPADTLRHCMTNELPEEIRNLPRFLIQRLPAAAPYTPTAPVSQPPPRRRTCTIHPYVEFTAGGICSGCAGDAKAAADDDDDDDDRRPPVPPATSTSPLPLYEDLASPDDESEVLRNYALARRIIDPLNDRERWLTAARKHLADIGEDFPGAVRTAITAAELYQASQQPDPQPPPSNDGGTA